MKGIFALSRFKLSKARIGERIIRVHCPKKYQFPLMNASIIAELIKYTYYSRI
jgi:hypothetical protein